MTHEGSCSVHITEKSALQDAQNSTFGLFAIQVDRLVSYSLVFIYLNPFVDSLIS